MICHLDKIAAACAIALVSGAASASAFTSTSAPENDARALAERLAAFSLLESKQVQSIVQCAREKIENEFNQLAINKQLASLLQTM